MLNDVYVNGQKKDIWCRSNKIITDPSWYSTTLIYDDVKRESCFHLSLMRQDFLALLFDEYSDTQISSIFHFCMCSN
jgi:hypothetical protein